MLFRVSELLKEFPLSFATLVVSFLVIVLPESVKLFDVLFDVFVSFLVIVLPESVILFDVLVFPLSLVILSVLVFVLFSVLVAVLLRVLSLKDNNIGPLCHDGQLHRTGKRQCQGKRKQIFFVQVHRSVLSMYR